MCRDVDWPFHPLCLVSRRFKAAATHYLYQAISLEAEWDVRLFARTVLARPDLAAMFRDLDVTADTLEDIAMGFDLLADTMRACSGCVVGIASVADRSGQSLQ